MIGDGCPSRISPYDKIPDGQVSWVTSYNNNICYPERIVLPADHVSCDLPTSDFNRYRHLNGKMRLWKVHLLLFRRWFLFLQVNKITSWLLQVCFPEPLYDTKKNVIPLLSIWLDGHASLLSQKGIFNATCEDHRDSLTGKDGRRVQVIAGHFNREKFSKSAFLRLLLQNLPVTGAAAQQKLS